jgi:hypothetical protein
MKEELVVNTITMSVQQMCYQLQLVTDSFGHYETSFLQGKS